MSCADRTRWVASVPLFEGAGLAGCGDLGEGSRDSLVGEPNVEGGGHRRPEIAVVNLVRKSRSGRRRPSSSEAISQMLSAPHR